MKTIITATIAIVVLMIGAPAMQSVLANQADTEKEAGIASDANGIPCTFGPNHDGCKDKIADDGTDVSNYPKLPPNQHYGTCEEDIHHELGCDVVNDTGSSNRG